ncbi:FecR family protein [Sphingobacterium cellulitidis]|uniref:FecR family protein n=1 Tax=Sphingobacterium cellulitidis TaxID=1768011 RepID=UPI000B93ACBE|nr:hypothetical protein CHT99_18195 [Sphingobacterium cellulitidis]
MKEKVLQILLRRYIKSEITEKESELLDSWYDSFEDVEVPGISASKKSFLQQQLLEEIALQNKLLRKQRIRRICFQISKIAACLMVCFGGYYFYNKEQHSEKEKASLAEINQIQYYETKVGERSRVDLPDGTSITLNPKSKIQVNLNEFNKIKRTIVLLRGDVFFQVKRDATKPFIVQAEDINTQVLGTSFMVSSYPELPIQKISVYTGLVKVSKGREELGRLKKGKELLFNKDQQLSQVRNFVPGNQQDREYGRLLLKQVTFEELAVQFNNYFGVELGTESKKIKNQHYTIPLDKKKSVEEMLKVVAELHHNQFRKEGDIVIFY